MDRFKNGVTPLDEDVFNKIVDEIEDLQYGETKDFAYTGGVLETTLNAGKYLLKCWGAESGTHSDTAATGKGGYVQGVLTLEEPTNLRIYVGGKGGGKSAAGGWNGSGSSGSFGGAGGGASDIRIGGTTLNHRIIVAAGGGGSGYTATHGGAGGGENGISGDKGNCTTGGAGGTQSAGGSVGTGGTSGHGNSGVFGLGGNGDGTKNNTGNGANAGNGGGGGGGWYGGGSGQGNGTDSAGGGGSSYVLTSTSKRPTGYIHGTSSKYNMTDTVNLDGSTVFLSPNGINETGHSGNGHVRILKKNSGGGVPQIQSDWSQINTAALDYIKNKPASFTPSSHTHPISQITGLSTVATTNNYEDLINKPILPSSPSSWVSLRPVTLVVGFSDVCDYKITGATSMQTVINSAISALPSTGGKIVLREGTYSFMAEYDTDGNGTIVGKTTQTVVYGENATMVTAIPNDGCKFIEWSDGVTAPSRSDLITGDFSVKALFRQIYTSGKGISSSG